MNYNHLNNNTMEYNKQLHETIYEKLNIGDKVFSTVSGWGTVIKLEINNDLDFLFGFWAEAKAIGQKILNELSQTKPIVKKKVKQGLLNFVNFSDVNDT